MFILVVGDDGRKENLSVLQRVHPPGTEATTITYVINLIYYRLCTVTCTQQSNNRKRNKLQPFLMHPLSSSPPGSFRLCTIIC